MNWQYIVQPTPASLGPVAIQVVLLGLLLMVLGIALVVLPKEFAGLLAKLRSRRSRAGQEEAGLQERQLRAELRMKVGTALAVWSGALVLSFLLRLLGTPGLDTRLLPALVVATLPFFVGYFLLYGLFFYPRYREESRRIDKKKSYQASSKKTKRMLEQVSGKEKVSLMPAKALIGLGVAPFLYYIVMVAVSVPPHVPAQNHDHLLHQFGMPVMALLGYVIGLAASLGDEIRVLLPWVKASR